MGDAAVTLHMGRFDDDEAGARVRQHAEMGDVPVGGAAVDCAVLAHGRDDNAIFQFDATEADRRKQGAGHARGTCVRREPAVRIYRPMPPPQAVCHAEGPCGRSPLPEAIAPSRLLDNAEVLTLNAGQRCTKVEPHGTPTPHWGFFVSCGDRRHHRTRPAGRLGSPRSRRIGLARLERDRRREPKDFRTAAHEDRELAGGIAVPQRRREARWAKSRRTTSLIAARNPQVKQSRTRHRSAWYTNSSMRALAAAARQSQPIVGTTRCCLTIPSRSKNTRRFAKQPYFLSAISAANADASASQL
jgi:hypothetical protein